MRKPLLLLFLLFAAFVSNGQVLLSESFDNTTFPPTGWATTTAGPTWTRVTAGTFPTQAPHTGAGEAQFNSWYVSSGTAELVTPSVSFSYATGVISVNFWMYRDNGYNTTGDKVDVYVNTSNSSSGGTLLGTINRAIGLSPSVSANGWYQYSFNIPGTFNGTSNYIIFKGTTLYGNDIYIDDVDITRIVPCTGTPTTGTVLATPNPVCPSVPFTLTAPGATVAAGMLYQWQSSPAGANTWTNIAGATTTTYVVAAGITANTDYRFKDSCTATNLGATSSPVSVTLNSYLNCYCTPSYSSGCIYGDDINTITLVGFAGTGINQVNSPCPSSNSYTDYSSLAPTKMIQGATYSGTLATDYSSEYCTMWIDFNNSGTFDPSEIVYQSSGGIAIYTATTSYSIAVPAAAPIGVHRMRVRIEWLSSPTDPCVSYSFGEARDYNVNIISAVPPSPLVTSNSPVCPFGTIVITATDSTGATGYPNRTFTLTGPWSGSPTTNTTGVFTIPNATTANAGAYSVTANSGSNTSAATNVTVVVYNTPTAITVGSPVSPTSCLSNNGSFTISGLSPSTSYTLLYRKSNVAQTPLSITSLANGTYVLGGLGAASYDSIRVVSGVPSNCTSNVVTTPVVLLAPNPPPVPTLTYNSPVCPGSTLSFVVTNPFGAGSTYSWTGPSGYTSAVQNATRANMSASFNGTYQATIKVTATGCTSIGSISVTMTPSDPKPIALRKTYCQNDIAIPIGAITTLPGATLKYYDSAVGPYPSVNGYATPPTPSTAVPGLYKWFVSQTVNCESVRDTVYILVNPVPAPPTTQSTTLQYCQYDIASPLTASGQNIRWFTTPTGGLGTATAPTPSTLVPGTYYYYASQTTNFPTSSCESGRLTIAVIVKPKPQPPKVTSPLNLCQGDPIAPLTAIGTNLLWYTIPNGGVGVPVAPLPNTGYEDSSNYYVTQSVLGCESDRALIHVVVNYKPNGILTASSPWVCQDGTDSFYYYGNARSNAQYFWFAPLSASFISGQGTPGPVVIHFDTAGISIIRLTINNKGCISDLISAPITVRPLPKISFVNRQDVCKDQELTIALNHTESGISGYNWDFGSTDIDLLYGVVTTGGPFGVRYHTPGMYTVSATATKDMCTSKPINQAVYVHELPDATITVTNASDKRNPNDLCASDTLALMVKAVPEGATYVWTPSAYFQGLKDTLNNSVFAVISQTSSVKVHIRTAYGCESEDSIKVTTKPCCGVYFPNAFAPGDRQNNIFRPITIGIHKINTFRIVNRWGQVVYETKVERDGWNGTLNGTPQDMGTYYYYINYVCEGKNVEEHGEFLLLR